MGPEIAHRLKAKEIQPTAMRMLVLNHLQEQQAAITLTDLEKGLAPADRITIYRTLKTFEEKGVVHAVEDGTGATKYALCMEECNVECHHDLHVHFYCQLCKETICLPKTSVPEVTLPVDYQPESFSLLVKGRCPNCRK
jgi:Fur family ferric uptake transcriptional regulator